MPQPRFPQVSAAGLRLSVIPPSVNRWCRWGSGGFSTLTAPGDAGPGPPPFQLGPCCPPCALAQAGALPLPGHRSQHAPSVGAAQVPIIPYEVGTGLEGAGRPSELGHPPEVSVCGVPLGQALGPTHAGTGWSPGALLNLPAGSLCRVCSEHPADTTVLLIAWEAGPFTGRKWRLGGLPQPVSSQALLPGPFSTPLSCEVRAQDPTPAPSNSPLAPRSTHDSRDPGAVGGSPLKGAAQWGLAASEPSPLCCFCCGVTWTRRSLCPHTAWGTSSLGSQVVSSQICARGTLWFKALAPVLGWAPLCLGPRGEWAPGQGDTLLGKFSAVG